MSEIFTQLIQGEYFYLIAIAVILLATKFLGLATRRAKLPAVVGALLAGVILGPSLLNAISLESEPMLVKTSEIGVILLMFASGLETDLNELKENGVAAFIVAMIGVVIPLIGGCVAYYIFNPEAEETINLFKAIFVGVTLTATSVSITVETLREMGKLSGRMGTTILGAAVIDDILGIIVLTAIISTGGNSAGSEASLDIVILKIFMFFIFVVITTFVVYGAKAIIKKFPRKKRMAIAAFAFCLILSYISEELFGVADITGAYFAGVILCNFGIKQYLSERFDILSSLFFSPIFFASIGLKTNLHLLTSDMLIFAIVLVIIAIATKIIGCGLGAKFCKFNNKDALAIGIGMVSRGEVALIVAQKGANSGLLESNLFPAIVFMVIVTTLITPIMLKVILRDKEAENTKTA